MARRRKQTHDPRQLSLFDAMANQIEEIREENILDDTREGSIPIPVTQVEQEQAVPAMPLQVEPVKEEERQPEPARTKKPFPFPTNDGEKRRLGVNGRGDSVYELQDGSRMYSPNPDIMQFLDGEKRTPEKLFEAGADDYLTIQVGTGHPGRRCAAASRFTFFKGETLYNAANRIQTDKESPCLQTATRANAFF